MNLTDIIVASGCMRLETISKNKIRRVKRDRTRGTIANLAKHKRFTKKQIIELFFENCIDCEKMAAIPQGAFAACKIHNNNERTISMREEKSKTGKENSRPLLKGWELTPLKYNSKLMNSIWGQYNRYSVHNFKKNTDAEGRTHGGVVAAIWSAILENHPPAANAAVTTTTVEAPRIIRTGNGL